MYSLEEIKRKKVIDGGSVNFITKEEVKWLIKQAEKLEELRKKNIKGKSVDVIVFDEIENA